MRKYCLAYDTINSGEWQGNELKKVIIEILIAAGAVNFETPVASTILFEYQSENTRIRYFERAIIGEFISATNRNGKLKSGIYYYLCMVARDTNGNYIERSNPDPGLAASLQEILDEI
jgi:hypothetical protein